MKKALLRYWYPIVFAIGVILGAAAELVTGDEVARSVADLRSRILARYTR